MATTYFISDITVTEWMTNGRGDMLPIAVQVTARDHDGAEHQFTATDASALRVGQPVKVTQEVGS